MNHCLPVLSNASLLHLLSEGAEVQRDLDFMRVLLAELEGRKEYQFLLTPAPHKPVTTDDKTIYHVLLLADAGLLREMSPGIYRLTGRGHDFLESIRDDDVWAKSKKALGSLGGYSLSMLADVAEGYVKLKLRDLGLPI